MYLYIYITSVNPCMCEMNEEKGVDKNRKQPVHTVSMRKDT